MNWKTLCLQLIIVQDCSVVETKLGLDGELDKAIQQSTLNELRERSCTYFEPADE
jgi:hypothetical protein